MSRELLIFRDARRPRDGPDIEQMMRYARLFRHGQLGRADVHALIKLHGIGVHYLAA